MQVACGNCQLTFDAPEGTTGLVCPICRSPLSAEASGGGSAAPASKKIDWDGGSLTELIALLSAPAVSAVVDVFPPGVDAPLGEVHLVAGGVSDSVYQGEATDDALDKLLLVTGAHFRVDPRLPEPITGDLNKPGPESGTLDARPLAHLMRYCEDFVITCGIEVWRGNETARVDYRRGEIHGVTVGGIDAPERLAEVMQWASGNYRLIIPAINLPATAPKHIPAPAPAPEPARAGTKTMFGIPQSEIAAARAAAEAIMTAQGVGTPAPPEVAPPPAIEPAAAVIEPVPAPSPIALPVAPLTPPGVPPSAVPSPFASRASASASASATKTMFGMVAPTLESIEALSAAKSAANSTSNAVVAEAAAAAQVAEVDTGRTNRIVKTGARKVAVPAPEIVPPAADAVAAAPAAAKEVGRTTHHGFEARPSGAQKKAEEPARKTGDKANDKSHDKSHDKTTDKSHDKTTDKAHADRPRPAQRPAALWTYVGVGFTFGLVLLGIYQLVGRLAH